MALVVGRVVQPDGDGDGGLLYRGLIVHGLFGRDAANAGDGGLVHALKAAAYLCPGAAEDHRVDPAAALHRGRVGIDARADDVAVVGQNSVVGDQIRLLYRDALVHREAALVDFDLVRAAGGQGDGVVDLDQLGGLVGLDRGGAAEHQISAAAAFEHQLHIRQRIQIVMNVPVITSSSLYFLSVISSIVMMQSAFSMVMVMFASDGLYLLSPSYNAVISLIAILFNVVV